MTVLSFAYYSPKLHSDGMTLLRASILLTTVFIAGPSWADDGSPDDPVMDEEFCFPITGVKGALDKFDGLKPHRVDTVGVNLTLSLDLAEGEALPERIELRDGDTIVPIPLDPQTHGASLTHIARSASNEASLCAVDPARAGRLMSERGYGVSMGMGVRFHETPGHHSLDQIEDGLKDGRAHYRKMVGAMGFMVPKFDHIAVAGQDPENPPRVWATKDGQDLAEPAFIIFNNARMIAMDTLNELEADSIRIEGDYRLSPSPDQKAVERFMK
jgi:hypothetical protein